MSRLIFKMLNNQLMRNHLLLLWTRISTILSDYSRTDEYEELKIHMNYTFVTTIRNYLPVAFLTSFRLVYSGTSWQHIQLQLGSITLGYSYQQIHIGSYVYSRNVYSKISFTYLMIDVSNNNKLAYLKDRYQLCLYSPNTGFSFSSIFNSSFLQICIVSLEQIQSGIRSSTTQLSLQSINNTISLTRINIDYFQYSYVCIQECFNSTIINYPSSTTTCVLSTIDHCLTYVSSTICSKCVNGYFLSSNQSQCALTCPKSTYPNTINYTCESCVINCLICVNGSSCDLCNTNYYAAMGGCTNITGCIGIDSFSNKCNSCQTDLSFYLVNGTCKCQSGYKLVTRLCTNVAGCNVAILENSRAICISCDSVYNFIISNGSCICTTGYQMDSSNVCTQICGDGILLKLSCDDGNNQNGDGCSSTCSVQDYFRCSGGSSSSPSQCRYLKKDISLSVVRIDRAGNNNIAVFTFKLLPALTSYDMINLTESVSFGSNLSISHANSILEGDQLTVRIAFFEDIEGREADISISLDPTYFFQSNVSLRFKIVSDGVNLYVLADASKMNIIQNGIKFLAFTILGCFFASFFAHKMIGVEMLSSLQVAFYVHLTNPSYTLPYSAVKQLFPAVFDFLQLKNGLSNTYESQQRIKFSNQNEDFTIYFINGISIGIAVIFSIIKAIIFCLEKGKKPLKPKKSSEQVNSLKKTSNKIYQHVVFPFLMGTFLVSIMLMKSQRSSPETSWIISLLYFYQTILTSLVLFYQQKILFLSRSANQGVMGLQRCHRLYISIYVSFLLAVGFILNLGYQFVGMFDTQLILSALYFAFLVFVMIFQPYQACVHNLGLAANLLSVLYFIIWSTLKRMEKISESQSDQTIYLGVFLLLVIISLAITLVRFVQQLKIKCLKKQIKSSTKNGQKSKLKNENLLQQQQVFMKRISKKRVQRFMEIQPSLFVPVPIKAPFVEDPKSIQNIKAEFRKKYIGVSKRQLRDQLF